MGFDHGSHTLIRDGQVLIDGNRIEFVGRNFAGNADSVIDARGKLVSPGFIDTHVHAGHRASHKLISDVGRREYYGQPQLEISVAKEGKTVKGEPRYLRKGETHHLMNLSAPAELTVVELIRCGVTTFVEFGSSSQVQSALIACAKTYGPRIYVGPGYDCGRWVADSDGRLKRSENEGIGFQGLRDALDFIAEHQGAQNGRIQGILNPRELETVTPRILAETRNQAEKHGLPVATHAAYSVIEFHDIVQKYLKTPIEVLHQHGLLSPTFNIGHGNYISDSPLVNYVGGRDLELMGTAGVTVSHCSTNLIRRGRSLHSWDKYRKAGVNLTLGSDTYPRDMIMNMRIASYMGKLNDRHFGAAPAADVFSAATLGGAKSLGRDDLGRISKGALADVIVIDLSGRDSLRFGAVRDPIKALVECGVGDDVDTAIIDGVIRMKDRKVFGCDLDALRIENQKAAQEVWDGWIEADPLCRSADEMSPWSFPQVG